MAAGAAAQVAAAAVAAARQLQLRRWWRSFSMRALWAAAACTVGAHRSGARRWLHPSWSCCGLNRTTLCTGGCGNLRMARCRSPSSRPRCRRRRLGVRVSSPRRVRRRTLARRQRASTRWFLHPRPRRRPHGCHRPFLVAAVVAVVAEQVAAVVAAEVVRLGRARRRWRQVAQRQYDLLCLLARLACGSRSLGGSCPAATMRRAGRLPRLVPSRPVRSDRPQARHGQVQHLSGHEAVAVAPLVALVARPQRVRQALTVRRRPGRRRPRW